MEAERGYLRSRILDPELSRRFLLLEAESMLWRGLNEDALRIISAWSPSAPGPDELVHERTLEGVALNHLQRYREASQRFAEADRLCSKALSPSCGGLLRAEGVSSISRGELALARVQLLESLSIGRRYGDRFAEATAFLNLGVVSIQSDHYDDAVDWSNAAYQEAVALGAEDLAQNASANLGWSYFKLGDAEKALDLLLEAEKNATKLGDTEDEIKWLTTAAYIYQDNGSLDRASESYDEALKRAQRINSKDDIANCLEDLAHIAIQKGEFDKAEDYISQVAPMIQASGNRLDQLDVMLAKGAIAAGRHYDNRAEEIFRAVENDRSAQISMKLGAEHQLALLYERQGNSASADHTYRNALTTFESARDELKNEASKLPFLANATGIYDDFIHFLVVQRKHDEALRVADQSRARTLAQGLGILSNKSSSTLSELKPVAIARRAGATLLFYWLGPKQSYMWAITAKNTSVYTLPPQHEIKDSVDRYRRSLLGFGDPLENSDADGRDLYTKLIAPASSALGSNPNVIILSDGPLSQLNFETLILPTPHPHYWIEDTTITSAPSLQMLAATHTASSSGRKLLLIGDAISPNPDYPKLPMASAEMNQISQHFDSADQALFARERATPTTYLTANPQQFAYIHFVAHGVASRTDPLDSAIILSRSSSAEDSFKLHARDIIKHPIHANLVTVSACYGSGTRSYAGEGSIGLAWAFLRAGAHNVIGALWEVSDESTPQLMGDLYQGLEHGLPPNSALRQAKLTMLHSHKEFRKPFYWAPLQIYTGL